MKRILATLGILSVLALNLLAFSLTVHATTTTVNVSNPLHCAQSANTLGGASWTNIRDGSDGWQTGSTGSAKIGYYAYGSSYAVEDNTTLSFNIGIANQFVTSATLTALVIDKKNEFSYNSTYYVYQVPYFNPATFTNYANGTDASQWYNQGSVLRTYSGLSEGSITQDQNAVWTLTTGGMKSDANGRINLQIVSSAMDLATYPSSGNNPSNGNYRYDEIQLSSTASEVTLTVTYQGTQPTPPAPSSLTATKTTGTNYAYPHTEGITAPCIVLNWTDNAPSNDLTTYWQIQGSYYSDFDYAPSTNLVTSISNSTPTTTYTDFNFGTVTSNYPTIYYRVASVDAYGVQSAWSNTATVSTGVPTTPTGFTATLVKNGTHNEVHLAWNSQATVSFQILRDGTSDQFTVGDTASTFNINAGTYTYTDASSWVSTTTIGYMIRSVNAGMYSAYSAIVSVNVSTAIVPTTTNPPFTLPTFSGITDQPWFPWLSMIAIAVIVFIICAVVGKASKISLIIGAILAVCVIVTFIALGWLGTAGTILVIVFVLSVVLFIVVKLLGNSGG